MMSSTTGIAHTIGVGSANGNANTNVINGGRPKIARSATTTYGRQQQQSQADGGRLAVLVEDVDAFSGGSLLTRTRSRSRGISIHTSQSPSITSIGHSPTTGTLNGQSDHPNHRINSNIHSSPSTSASASNRLRAKSSVSIVGTIVNGGAPLSPIPQSPLVWDDPTSPSARTYSSNRFTSPSSSIGLGLPQSSTPTASSSVISSQQTLAAPQDRRKGLTRRISSPTMRAQNPLVFPLVIQGFQPVGADGYGRNTNAENTAVGLDGNGIGGSGHVPGSSPVSSIGPPGGHQIQFPITRTPSKLQYGHVSGSGYVPPSTGGYDGGGLAFHSGQNVDSSTNAFDGISSLASNHQTYTSPASSATAISSMAPYEPYRTVRPRSTSVNGFADANFGSPTTAAAAGGILGGFWLAGTALLGTMVGGGNGNVGGGSGYEGIVEQEDETGVGRPSSAYAMGKWRSQGSDSEGEKGYITPPLGQEQDGTRQDLDRTPRIENNTHGSTRHYPDYFALPPSASLGESGFGSGNTLPTPTLSSASLSGRHTNHGNDTSSPSKQRRRRASTTATTSTGAAAGQRPFSSLRNFFHDIGAGLVGSQPGRLKYSPAPSPAISPPMYAVAVPIETGSEQRQVRTRGNSSASKRPQGLPPATFQPSTRARSEVELEPTVPLLEALRETIKDMGWTLGIMGLVFVSSLGVVAMLLRSLPIHSLKSLPKKVSDIQVLSAEIRSYMGSGSRGWWHVILTLVITGCWKHSWSIPGAVILNILVGSLMKPIPAVVLLTVITSLGSLGAYTLSRPLAPLIGLVFPKPLALVRTAISGSSLTDERTTSQSADTYEQPSEGRPTVWRRLLVMRAMGVVPWSGMNVACGVVGVNWMTFVLTTAAGSASWSYVTANVGDILSQLAIPRDAVVDGFEQPDLGASSGSGAISGGQSLSGLLRDPALIAKLVVLSMLSLLPVLFKSRSDPAMAPPPRLVSSGGPNISLEDQASTPLAPTPSVYYLAASLRHVIRGAIRGAESIWRTSWIAMRGYSSSNTGVEPVPMSAR